MKLQSKPHLKNLYRVNPDEKSRKGFLRLDMNEGIPGLPESFVADLSAKINPGILSSYPEYKTLQDKIAALNHLRPENICLSNGSDGAIKYIFDAYISKGDKILLTDPTFAMYQVYSRIFNAHAITIEYRPDLSFPTEEFLNNISSRLKLAVVVSPNNPAGSIIPESELLEIIKKTSARDVLLVIDEAYFYFYPQTAIEKVKKYKNLIVLRTFSKLCALASLRLGYAAACPEIIEGLRKVKPTFDVNGIAVLFGNELLKRPNVINRLIKSTKKGEEYLVKRLSESGIEYKKSYANFLLIKCNRRVEEIMEKLAKKKILVNGRFRQPFLKDYIRVTLGDKNSLEKFWKAFYLIWQ